MLLPSASRRNEEDPSGLARRSGINLDAAFLRAAI